MSSNLRIVMLFGATLFLQACENSPTAPSDLTSPVGTDVLPPPILQSPSDFQGERLAIVASEHPEAECGSPSADAKPCVRANSWFSDFTGINIDIPNGRIDVGLPDPIGTIDRIGQTLIGAPLKQAILTAKHNAGGGQPIPTQMQHQLRQLGVREDLLHRARWNSNWRAVDVVFTTERNAVALQELIVFRNPADAYNNRLLWVHELKHFEQYERLGLDRFASEYTLNSWVYENEAIDAENQAAARRPPGGTQIPQPNQPIYYSYCSTWMGNSPTIAGGLPAGSSCSIPGPFGPVWGTVVGFYR